MREYKTLTFKAGDTSGLDPDCFQGYASTFGPPIDSAGDIIERGAFANTIADFLASGAVAWQHDWTEPIGKAQDMREDAHGLYIRGRISQTARGKDALVLLRDGVVTKMSIGYQPLGYRILSDDEGRQLLGDAAYDAALRDLPWYMDGIRVLTDIKLYEVSLVTVPANANAVVTGVKGDGALAGLTLEDHFSSVLAAEREYITRMKGLADLRTKEGRVLSEANRSRLVEMRSSLATHCTALDEMIAAATPVVDTTEDDEKAASEDAERKAALVEMARREMIRFQHLEARLNGAL